MKRLVRLLGLATALVLAPIGQAADRVPFHQILSPTERQAIGLTRLTSGQTAALDVLVERDVRAARQGDVVAFARTFSERRTPEERQRTGIDSLAAEERQQLDAAVATLIAARPSAAFLPPAPINASGDAVRRLPDRAEVHGAVSMFYGRASGGGSFYGGAIDAFVTDPSKKLTVGIGLSEVRTKGLGRPYCGW